MYADFIQDVSPLVISLCLKKFGRAGRDDCHCEGLSSSMRAIYSMPSSRVEEKTLMSNFEPSQSFKHRETMIMYVMYMYMNYLLYRAYVHAEKAL